MSFPSKMMKNPLYQRIDSFSVSPQKLLAEVNHGYPGLWRFIDEQRINRDEKTWPAWCFAPRDIWNIFLVNNPIKCFLETYGKDYIDSKKYFFSLSPEEKDKIKDPYLELFVGLLTTAAAPFMALGSWRPTQSICHFEKTLGDSLSSASLSGKIPSDVFLQLPEWCIYVDTTNLDVSLRNIKVNGFFVLLDTSSHKDELANLNFYYNLADGTNAGRSISLGDWTLEEAISREIEKRKVQFGLHNIPTERQSTMAFKQMCDIADITLDKEILSTSLNLSLYLCSEKPDIINHQQNKKWEKNIPTPKKIKGGYRIFPPNEPVEWILGGELEKQISHFENTEEKNRQKESGTHASPRPHIRKAHWHGYWTGPRDKQQEFKLLFLPPTPVALSEKEPLDEIENSQETKASKRFRF